MTDILLVRPADDPAAVTVGSWGQAVRQMAPGTSSSVDLAGASSASRAAVDGVLSPTVRHLFWFGHGEDDALVNTGARIVELGNVVKVTESVVAIACYSAAKLGPAAVSANVGPKAYLGFDDEFGFPASAPMPMALAVVSSLRGFLMSGHDLNQVAQSMTTGFDTARVQYKTQGTAMGLSLSDARTAWLFAKSNRYSLALSGNGGVTL